MIIKSFEQWDDEDIQFSLGFRQAPEEDHQKLQEWLRIKDDISLSETSEKLQKLLKENVNDWNEDELKIMFIAPLLNEIDFNNYPHYKVFSQRKVEFKTDKIEA